MIRFSCMELMWGGVAGAKLKPWLAEIAALGFDGAALRWATLQPYLHNSAVLAGLLKQHRLELAAAYLPIDQAGEQLQPLCELLRAVGCGSVVVHGGRAATDVARIEWAKRIDAMGAQATRLGVMLSYHHHSDSLFETLEQTELLLANSDPRHVGLFLDTGHATQDFQGHPVEHRARLLLERHATRARFVEFKAWTPERGLSSELGEGPLDLDGVVDWLVQANHTGWITLEQNAPTPDSTPGACAARSLAFAKKSFQRYFASALPK